MSESLESAKEVVSLYTELENREVAIWLDGGWAVDALLGHQTREHGDLDIAIERQNLPAFRSYIESLGYKEIERDENKKWDAVFRDHEGREIDVHAFSFAEDGSVVEADEFPEGSLLGRGEIDGISVRCIAPEHLVAFHLRHEPREKDFADVHALCEKFNIPIPPQYQK